LCRFAALKPARSAALTTLVLFQMFQVGNSRSETQSVFLRSPFSNPFLLIATTGALLIHMGALYFGPTQYVLRIVPLGDWGTLLRCTSSSPGMGRLASSWVVPHRKCQGRRMSA
jgi:magnesium-transporting ATPase (P-type)